MEEHLDMKLRISIRINIFFLTERDCHRCCCEIMKKEDLPEYSQRLWFRVGVGGGGSYVFTLSTPDCSTIGYRNNHGLSSLGNQ